MWTYLDDNSELSTFSPGPAEESSQTYCSDTAPSALSKLMPTAETSSSADSATECCPDSRSGTTCEHSTDGAGTEASTSSPADSPVKTSAQPAEALESPASDPGSGPKWQELSMRFDLNTCSWRTHRCLFDEVLPESSVILPRWGMMQSGVCWERIRSVPRIKETGYGSWPTPLARDWKTLLAARRGYKAPGGENCPTAVLKWLTPTANDRNGTLRRYRDGTKEEKGPTLLGQVKSFKTLTERGVRLHPEFHSWLMGWPTTWTDLRPLGMDKFQRWRHSHGEF